MRGIFALFVTLVIAAVVGVGAYQLGFAEGLGATGTAVGPAMYYPHFYGGFGFLFPLLFLFLIFALVGSAFSRRRGWSNGGGWGGHGYQSPRERLEELHRELHGEKPKDTGSSSSSPPSGR